jgi:hypothetical protein
MEPVIAMGALWRWRMPVLADIVEFFSRFGAFPSGTPRPHFVPEPPVAEKDRMQDVIAALDGLFTPVDGGAR